MDEDPYGNFTWRITEFTSRQSETKLYSDVFTVGGFNWRIVVYPNGNDNNGDHLSVFLERAAGGLSLPLSWRIKVTLTVLNQIAFNDSIKQEFTQSGLAFKKSEWGSTTFMRLSQLEDSTKGYLVNNTLVLEAEVLILIPYSRITTFFTNMDKFISDAPAKATAVDSTSLESPKLEEVEEAKKCLKECLSDLFKLNMKDKLATSLNTLSRAKIGLSSEQQQTVHMFCSEFDDFVSDFLTFEHDNSDFELQKIKRDEMFLCVKKNHSNYNTNKQLINDLAREETELKKRMEEAKAKKAKLESDSDALIVAAVKAKTQYTAQLKKLEQAEEKKRIAEERMSRSTSAWSALKSHFL